MKLIHSLVISIFFYSLALAEEVRVVPNEYIVTFKEESRNSLIAASRVKSYETKRPLNEKRDIELIKYSKNESFGIAMQTARFEVYDVANDECQKILAENPNLASCIPNFFIQTAVIPDDPYFENCTDGECVCLPGFDPVEDESNASQCLWGLDNVVDTDINAPEAWDITQGNANTIIAVIDTGIDYNHTDLAANVWVNAGEIADNDIDDDGNGYIDDVHGINAISGSIIPEGEPVDDHGHGTHVAGTIAALANNQGIIGVSPNAKVMAIKILDALGGGSAADAVVAINYVIKMREDYAQNIIAINASWGGNVPANVLEGENGLIATINAANDAGILFVAAAGNGDSLGNGFSIDSTPHYPASIDSPNMIAVASTTYRAELSRFSNFGPESVHVAAPGSNVRSLLADGVDFGNDQVDSTTATSGTSMAAPHVSGVLALMHDHFPALNHLALKDRLLNRVKPFALEDDASKILSGGIVNAYYALTDVEIPTPDPLPEPVEPEPSPPPTTDPSPEPSLSPSPSPSPSGDIGINNLVYRLEILGKSFKKKRRVRFKKRLFEGRVFKINISTIGLTTEQENLKLYFSLKDKQCSENPIEFRTSINGEAKFKGKLPKLPKKTKFIQVSLVDEEGNIREEKELRVSRNKRKRNRSKDVSSFCQKLNLARIS